MKLWSIKWKLGNNPNVAGDHKWVLPGIECPKCSAWGAIGSEYSAVDLSSVATPDCPFTNPAPVSPPELARLRSILRAHVPESWELHPGTELGPIVGEVLAKLGDFAWARKWTPLLSLRAYDLLRGKGAALSGVPAQLKPKRRNLLIAEYMSLHIEPQAALHPSCLPPARFCELCGRSNRGRMTKLVVHESSVKSDVPLFRVLEWETKIVASEEFRSMVLESNLTDVDFEPVQVEK